MSEASNVIRFPAQLRVVPIEAPSVEDDQLQLVEHDGRLYALRNLLTRLPAALRQEVSASSPRHAQAAWDLVVRRWPTVAARIIADAGAVPIVG